jgi:hypothetical protein
MDRLFYGFIRGENRRFDYKNRRFDYKNGTFDHVQNI